MHTPPQLPADVQKRIDAVKASGSLKNYYKALCNAFAKELQAQREELESIFLQIIISHGIEFGEKTEEKLKTNFPDLFESLQTTRGEKSDG